MKVSLVKEEEISKSCKKKFFSVSEKERSHKTMERDLLKALSFMLRLVRHFERSGTKIQTNNLQSCSIIVFTSTIWQA